MASSESGRKIIGSFVLASGGLGVATLGAGGEFASMELAVDAGIKHQHAIMLENVGSSDAQGMMDQANQQLLFSAVGGVFLSPATFFVGYLMFKKAVYLMQEVLHGKEQ